jgi:hypothetical protein
LLHVHVIFLVNLLGLLHLVVTHHLLLVALVARPALAVVDWSQLGRVDGAWGGLLLATFGSGGLLLLLVGEHWEGVLSKLDICVEVVQTLVVGAILTLGGGRSHLENIRLALAVSGLLISFLKENG